MSVPNASQVEIGILAESTWGVLPSPATFQLMRLTGESLNVNRENVVSNEIRPDRNVPDLVQVAGGAGGGINFELSYGTFDSLIESLMQSAWNTDEIVNGVTPKSFHIQKKFEGGTTDQFFLFTGMEVDSMNLNIAVGQIVTGAFTFAGKQGTLSQAATGSNTPATTVDVMNAASGIVTTTIGVSPLPQITTMTLNVGNGLRQRRKVGSTANIGIGAGRFNVTGSFQAYFEHKALVDAFLAGTAGALSFTIGTVTAEKYTISIPKLKISTATVQAGGNDQDVMVNCDFQGVYDAGISGTMKITRAVA